MVRPLPRGFRYAFHFPAFYSIMLCFLALVFFALVYQLEVTVATFSHVQTYQVQTKKPVMR